MFHYGGTVGLGMRAPAGQISMPCLCGDQDSARRADKGSRHITSPYDSDERWGLHSGKLPTTRTLLCFSGPILRYFENMSKLARVCLPSVYAGVVTHYPMRGDLLRPAVL